MRMALQRAFPSLETLAKLAGLAITLLSGTYAIYQKIYFAEFNMNTRLREFLEREELQLDSKQERTFKRRRIISICRCCGVRCLQEFMTTWYSAPWLLPYSPRSEVRLLS